MLLRSTMPAYTYSMTIPIHFHSFTSTLFQFNVSLHSSCLNFWESIRLEIRDEIKPPTKVVMPLLVYRECYQHFIMNVNLFEAAAVSH